VDKWLLAANGGPSLQDGIEEAGSPVNLLWRTGVTPWMPAVIRPEFVGWREEQLGWLETVALMDLSYHMWDTFISGPDATRLLSELSVNDYDNFAVGQAKQLVAVTQRGLLVGDGILLRHGEDEYILTGRSTTQSWITYHAEKHGYKVNIVHDPDCSRDPGHIPRLFRYQVQGPNAQALIENIFGRPLPRVPFFHTTRCELNGITFRALRHGMAGQPGYEFIGDYANHDRIKTAILKAGEDLGLVQVGALAYPTAQCESGWIPAPTPAFYTDPELLDYRRWASLNTVDGRQPLHGSFFSPDIEDYYVNPWEIGYGKLICFDHDFLGRDALKTLKDETGRTKVTLVADPGDVREKFGTDHFMSSGRYRVEASGNLIGVVMNCAFNNPLSTILGLAILDKAYSAPGTEVSLIMGDHPGPGTDSNLKQEFTELRATVQPCPYNEFARTEYRKD